MENKQEKLPKAEEVKKQLEALAGRDLHVPADQLIRLWYPAGAYSYNDGNACWRSVFPIFPGKSCSDATLLDVSGVNSTADNGQLVFQISEVVCFMDAHALSEPINVVVTPRSSSPSFATQTHALINSNTDVQITVYTWDANGNPAPNVAFDWRCRVVSEPIIFARRGGRPTPGTASRA
ncbi:MAG: hypothetical protein WA789_07140 [Candidatus Acidiferrum sp.]